MVSTPTTKSQAIAQSKIIHKSPVLHRLARFVTEEAAAMMFNIKPEQIKSIKCLRYVVHVHAEGVSRFVSYADFPLILGEVPTAEDFVLWRKRSLKRRDSKQAPELWQKFYINQFQQARSLDKLMEWGLVVSLVKSLLSEEALHCIRKVYAQEKYALSELLKNELFLKIS